MRFEDAAGRAGRSAIGPRWVTSRSERDCMVRIYAFVMVLSYSRFLYVEFTRSMRLETLIRCHQNAFAFLAAGPSGSSTTTCGRSWSGRTAHERALPGL